MFCGLCGAPPPDTAGELDTGLDFSGPTDSPLVEPARETSAASVAKSISAEEEEDSEIAAYTNDPDVILCKFACGKPVQPGKTRKGNAFDTCCRGCSLNQGLGVHDGNCGGCTPTGKARQACSKGARCRDRSDPHLEAQAHPLDEDYATACAATKGVEAVPLSLKVLFDWTDADGSGKLSREELESSLVTIKKICGSFLPTITDEAWHHLDEDGNGVVNFSEFAAWAGPRLGLPLGMQRMIKRTSSASMSSPCSVLGCPCEAYNGKDKGKSDKEKCKDCKHKHGLHVSRVSTAEVPCPEYWSNHDGEFNTTIEMDSAVNAEFQQLLDKTYRNKTTRDRKVHNPTMSMVPKGFKVTRVLRNENHQNWTEYGCRRAEVLTRIEEGDKVEIFSDVKSAVAWKEIGGAKADRLVHECNEWYLFHGTNPSAAKAICSSDFKVSRAGSSTGTLYGKGLYFAESITKADEYAKPNESGNYAVLLCRIIGGHVRYTDSVTPDPEDLCHSCIEGDFDCVLGDREKTRGTYREFVLFDSEDVYPEYIIEYQRKYT